MPTKKSADKDAKSSAKKATVKPTAATKAPAKAKAPEKATAKAKAPAKTKATAKAKAPAKAKATAKAKAPAKAEPAVAKAPAKAAPAKTAAAASKTPVKKATAKKAQTKAAPKTTKPAQAQSSAPIKTASNVARAVGQIQKFDGFKPYKPTRSESYMNQEQLEHFKELLHNWRSELVEEMTRTVSHMKDEASNFPDPADRATQEEEFSLELRTRDRERKLIKKIDSTLERISIDDYGYCDACGIEIGVQRLEVRPTATLCIDCKTLAEIKERQELG